MQSIDGNGVLKSVSVVGKDKQIKELEADYLIPLFGLSPKLGPLANWGLNIDKSAIEVNTVDYSTNIPGVFLIRLPQFRSRPACIGVELDVLNRGGGSSRRRGIILRTKEELKQLLDVVTNKKLEDLTSSIEKINPTQQANMGAKLDTEIFEI